MELKDLDELNLSPDVRMFMEEYITNTKQFATYSEYASGKGLKVFVECERPRLSVVYNPDPTVATCFYFTSPLSMNIDNFGDNYKILDTIIQPEIQKYREKFMETLRATVTGLDKPVKVSNKVTTDMQDMVRAVPAPRNARGAVRGAAQAGNPFARAPQEWIQPPGAEPQVVGVPLEAQAQFAAFFRQQAPQAPQAQGVLIDGLNPNEGGLAG